jgi:hypothetical protein
MVTLLRNKEKSALFYFCNSSIMPATHVHFLNIYYCVPRHAGLCILDCILELYADGLYKHNITTNPPPTNGC